MSYEIIDPTRLRDSLQCLRLFYFRHERHLIPIAPRMPLLYGSGVHASLAAHYQGQSAGLALKAFQEIWDTEVVPWQDDMTEEDPRRCPARWLDVFMLYREHYKIEPFKVLAVEAPFFLPLSKDIALAGIIDLLVDYLNQVMVWDHKTTSVTWPSYFAGFNPNHQFSAYLLGATEILEKPVTTALINCIVTASATEKRPEKLFMRVPTTRSPAQHQFLKEEILSWWEVVRSCREKNAWPRNDDRCQRWQGGCEYLPLCLETQIDYRKLIPSKALYRQQIWDPLRELRQAGFNQTV